MRLVAYDGSCAPLVVAWCADSTFSSEWVPSGVAPDAVLAQWHEDPDISGHLLLRAGVPVAYGELWVELDEDEAELAHLVVDPALREQGLGAALGRALAARAAALVSGVYLRVHPDNLGAAACYRSVGFARVGAADEAAYNAGQPAAYHWMRLGTVAP